MLSPMPRPAKLCSRRTNQGKQRVNVSLRSPGCTSDRLQCGYHALLLPAVTHVMMCRLDLVASPSIKRPPASVLASVERESNSAIGQRTESIRVRVRVRVRLHSLGSRCSTHAWVCGMHYCDFLTSMRAALAVSSFRVFANTSVRISTNIVGIFKKTSDLPGHLAAPRAGRQSRSLCHMLRFRLHAWPHYLRGSWEITCGF